MIFFLPSNLNRHNKQERIAMNMYTSVFNDPVINEFRTKKAAEKYAARTIGGAHIRESYTSAFDMYHPDGKKLFQVYEGAE